MRKSWTMSMAALALLSLNGCILPPVVTLASYSADLVTYEATGKTATDHVYSAIARSDCSFIRVLHREPICVDPPAPETKIAAAAEIAPATEVAEPKDAERKMPTAGLPTPAAERSQHLKVAIGSFLDQANAERSVARYAEWHPVMTNVTVAGRQFHRVVATSLSADEAAALKAKMAADQPAKLRVAQAGGNVVNAAR